MKKLKLMVQGAAAAVALTLAFGVNAQNAQPPAGLKWQMMREIVFNSKIFASTGTPEDRALLEKIWAKELAGTEKSPLDGSLLPSFSLVGTIEHAGDKFLITMYNRAGSDCIQPGNGRGMVDMYATCSLRLIWWPNGKPPVEKVLPINYCMLTGDDKYNPRAQNHNEYAFDERTGVIYLRLIQHGRIVPQCNRGIRVL
jgi:hypothetical protein